MTDKIFNKCSKYFPSNFFSSMSCRFVDGCAGAAHYRGHVCKSQTRGAAAATFCCGKVVGRRRAIVACSEPYEGNEH